MPRPLVPAWLRRGLEAAIAAALVAIAVLWGDRLSAGGAAVVLPAGPAGALLLAPPVLALGAVAPAYPVAMAATRADAILGAVTGYLVGADLVVIFAGSRIELVGTGLGLPAGALVALVALAGAAAAVAGSQVGASLGFGRRAGAVAAAAGAIGSAVGLIAVSVLA